MDQSRVTEGDIMVRDVDPIVEAVSRLFGHHRVLACGPAKGFRRLRTRSIGTTLVGRLEYASDFSCLVDQPRRHLVLTLPEHCNGQMGRDHYARDDVLAFNVDWCGHLDLSPPGIFLNTAISDEQLRLSFTALYGFEPEAPVRFAERLPGSSRAAVRARQVIGVLHDSDGESAVLQKFRESWAAMELLSLWPHNYSQRVHREALLPATVRRAVDYIHANLDRPISVVDIAVAVKVGARALTDAFTRHLGESPGRYTRTRRLEAARLMLETDPCVTVIDAAARWHFSNPGMFAGYFRERFGYLPGEARRRLFTPPATPSPPTSASTSPAPS